LFRHAIHPVSFQKRVVFAVPKFWNLTDQPDGSVLGSLAWERYAPTGRYVHEHGCRLASRRNEAKRRVGKYDEKQRQVYCGAYQLSAKSIRSIASDQLAGVLSADVIHQVEEGEIAHTDLRFHLQADGFDIEATKTAIIDRLWNASSGPLTHVCHCDRDITPHPNSHLDTPPLGAYRDNRSMALRLWGLIRFKVWLWFQGFRF